MFENHSNIYAYQISLNLDQYLIALFNLCYDVYIKINNINIDQNEIEIATQLFDENYLEELDIDIKEYLKKEDGKYIAKKEELFANLATNLNLYYLKSDDFTNSLKVPEYIYYLKDNFVVYSTINNSKDFVVHINNRFKTIDIISNIIDHINDNKLKESIKSVSAIYDFNKLYSRYISVAKPELVKPELFKIKYDYLNTELIKEEIFDYENIWINYKNEHCKELNFDNEKDEYYLIKDRETEKELCIKVNDYVLFRHSIEKLIIFVKQEFKNQFLWQYFQDNLFKKKENTFINNSELVNSFIDKSSEPDFNKLICNIKYNLYIDKEIEIKEDYKIFFQDFVLINKLDELNHLNFFVPDELIEKELLSIYTEVKIGEKYNLLHYLKHKDDKNIETFVNSSPQKKQKKKVHILKAELAYYFVEKYYEDVIEKLLKELKVNYISNVELFLKGDKNPKAEFDFIIFKNNKFYFLEAKTTLSNDNVYSTLKKYNQNINLLSKIPELNLVDFRFILLGLLSNSNLDNYKHFFSDEGYNIPREGFVAIPYKFNVPFFNYQEVKLECIAEPELLKLKEFIKDICQI
ncbi:hypothetical protein [Elizabethkingia meningoseptica]|uniref:hypothetical protein n=1 Tax=Elizabethkingia meningoseptica TaxID=238 RepID=UPI002DD68A3D|nr:hypothetical protein [Elizabethkingia meningoseptica]MEC4711847.1 hypothetical protein [Elizabethkingia meningoseptica]